jgi:endonuclease/exonuclease/phosphatase family metal-dependent hydrolase
MLIIAKSLHTVLTIKAISAMKTLFRLLPLAFLLTFCVRPVQQHELRIMTFNIRYDNPADAPSDWNSRLPVIKAYLDTLRPDIMGVQEALYHQNEDLLKIMPGYAYFGGGRDDGLQSGEYSSVFYRTDRFEILEHAQFWLSETPDIPGTIGWEAILPRIVTWGKFLDIATGKTFYVFNTHYSHVSDGARRRSMELMSDMMTEIAGDEPVVVTGDFNIRMNSELYNDMVNHFDTRNNLQNAALLSNYPEEPTFNGFRDMVDAAAIDYIFFSKDFFTFKNYAVDKIKEDDVFISDHWPVWSDLIIRF